MRLRESDPTGRGGGSVLRLLPWLLVSFLLASLASTSLVAAHGVTAETGAGSFADATASYIPISQAGNTTIFAVSGSGVISGTLSGSYTFSGTLQANDVTEAVHYSLTDIFTVMVDGQPGTITVSEIGEGSAATHSFASQFNIVNGTGGLADLNGQGRLNGTQGPVTLLDTGTYTVFYFFS